MCRLDVLCRLDVRVGLKLALCFNSSLLEVLKLPMLTAPHRHKALLQPGGALFLVLYEFKTILRLLEAFSLAVSAEGGIPCADLTSLFHAGISHSSFLMSLLSF